MCNQGGVFEYYAFDINRGTAHAHLRMSDNEQRWKPSGFLTTDIGTGSISSNERSRAGEFSLKSILKIQYILLLVTGTTHRKDYTPNSYSCSFGKGSGFR
jgi:hypothetical protein